MLAADQGRTVAERIGAWARRFQAAGTSNYTFGPADGGYVAEGRLALDRRQDCISLMYRCSELGRAGNAAGALAVALRTRFAGAVIDSIVGPGGRVDYERPEHLDYSLDMIRTGHWGTDITATFAGAVLDTAGSSRYAAGSFSYLPQGSLLTAELREGDIAWLVLDPTDRSGSQLRQQYGLVIGHVGIVVLEDEGPWLIHAASRPLSGYYDAGGVVGVPLAVYLARVPKFCGVVITRFD